VQYSVFECKIDAAEWAMLRARLLALIDTKEDSMRFYFLDEREATKTEHHGIRVPVDFEGPLVV
jgi:CRISPR-associated protein Cas2